MAKIGNYIMNSEIVKEYDLADDAVWPNFETPAWCKTTKTKNIGILCEHNFGDVGEEHDPYDKALKRLRECTTFRRCLSPACANCVREYRRWYVAHGLKAMERYGEVHFVTWVPDPHLPTIPFRFNPTNFATAFLARVKRALPPAVAARITLWGQVEL